MNAQIKYDEYIEQRLNENVVDVINYGRSMIKPKPELSVSEWADQNRVLPETSFEGGRWETAKTPHLRLPMDCATFPEVRQISFMKSSQCGGTEFALNTIGYFIDVDPCGIILMQPTDNDARDFSAQKLEPMIDDTRSLKEKVARKNKNDGQASILRKKFVGGHLQIVSGKTTSSTRQRSARVTIGDDIDGIEIGHVKEGDPILRLIKRSTTYHNHLNINISTPTVDGESRIAALYEKSNKMKYHVRCPHCGVQQILKYENLHWEQDKNAFGDVTAEYPETAKYGCEGCGTLLNEAERIAMLMKGEWIADRPEIKDHYGFWINELSSTLSSMSKVARAIIDAGDDNEKLEALHNTVFGIPWKRVHGEGLDTTTLLDRREDYINPDNPLIPNEVLLITTSVDLQAGSGDRPARFEYETWGWGKDEECWILDRGFIPGNPQELKSWVPVDQYLSSKTFERKDGAILKPVIKYLDSGWASQSVYDFVKKRNDNTYAIKGANKHGAPLLPKRANFVDSGKVLLINIGTQAAKHVLFDRLTNIKEYGPRFIHHTKHLCDADYYRQLEAEHAVKITTGLIQYIVYEKKKRGLANEAIDNWVYNYAAMKAMNPNWNKLQKNIEKRILEVEEEKEQEVEVKQQRKLNKRPRNNSYKIRV